MFQLDDDFQKEIGIFDMPVEPKEKLIEGITKTINDRVLIKLSDQITNEKTDELERLTHNPSEAKKWLEQNVPNYITSQEYEEFKKQIDPQANTESMFAINKWFAANLPTYPQVLTQTIEEVKGELKAVSGK